MSTLTTDTALIATRLQNTLPRKRQELRNLLPSVSRLNKVVFMSHDYYLLSPIGPPQPTVSAEAGRFAAGGQSTSTMTWVRTDAAVDLPYEDQDEFMLTLRAE